MKFRPARAAVVLIGTSLLPLAGIRSAQAAEIKIVSPNAYKDREGEGALAADCCAPYHYQRVFPAEDFAALGGKPHWLIYGTVRPDQSVTSPRTAHWPDLQLRLATVQLEPPNLSLRFDDNLGSNFKHWYRGPATGVADVDGPGPGPREFYTFDYPAGHTPYLYDPSQGNLLFDAIAWQGVSPSHRTDLTTSIQVGVSGSALATQGSRQTSAPIFQFTFIPVTPGDYNQDATVDAADYVVWRDHLGTTYTQADYDVWRANFGQTIGRDQALPSAEPLSIASVEPLPAVPEPSTALVVCVGSLALFACWRPTHFRLRR
jgi:hypothetical protein